MKEGGWDNVALWYDEYLRGEDTYQERVIAPNLLRMLAANAGDHILDVACGQGYFAHKVAASGAHAHGVDASRELIARAERDKGAGETFFVGDAERLGEVGLASYTAAYSVLAFENIKNISAVLDGIRQHLAPEGKVILVMLHPAFRVPQHSDWKYDPAKNVQSRVVDKYLSEVAVPIELAPFKGASKIVTTTYHRSLQWYMKAFRNAGFAIANMEEWISHKTSEPGPRKAAEDAARKEFPLFLAIDLRVL